MCNSKVGNEKLEKYQIFITFRRFFLQEFITILDPQAPILGNFH